MKVVIDVFGGDNSPGEILNGAFDALKTNKNVKLILVGKQEVIKDYFSLHTKDIQDRLEVIDAQDIITNDDVPTLAIKQKKDSSLVKALDLLKERDDAAALVSAGSTGAILIGGILRVGRIEGINRAALAPILPTLQGTPVCLIDSGANVDSRPEYMSQFALMGDAYMRSMYKTATPRVALLSNGVEEKKGNDAVKEAHQLIKQLHNINFVGNMEAREALSGDYDVIVADGFSGNVLLKSLEGGVSMVLKLLKRSIKKSFSAKIGALFMGKVFKQLKKDMDYNSFGGAPFLGIEKIVIKSHGSADRIGVCTAILQAHAMAENNLVSNIKQSLMQTANQSSIS